MTKDGNYRCPPNRVVFGGNSFPRIDSVMVYSALSYLEMSAIIEYVFVESSQQLEGDMESLVVRRHPPTAALFEFSSRDASLRVASLKF